jgi:hypothetical protein
MPRRFDEAALRSLLADRPAATGDGSGGGSVEVRLVHGVRIFTDLLPGALVDGDPEAAQALLDLERAASEHPDRAVLSAVAAQLHLVAQRRA